jgi:hypothetical protein
MLGGSQVGIDDFGVDATGALGRGSRPGRVAVAVRSRLVAIPQLRRSSGPDGPLSLRQEAAQARCGREPAAGPDDVQKWQVRVGRDGRSHSRSGSRRDGGH